MMIRTRKPELPEKKRLSLKDFSVDCILHIINNELVLSEYGGSCCLFVG